MKKKVSAIILAGVVLLSSSFTFAQKAVQDKSITSVRFDDVTKHWSKEAVQNLLKINALPFNQEKFIPGKAIKKSEFVLMLHKALNINIAYLKAPDIKDYFDDVKADAPYASALIDLVTANIIEGKGKFKPEGTLTREEMVHYVMQAYKYKMGDNYPMIKIAAATFKDADKIKPEYSGDIARAQHYKLIGGSGKNMFHPKKAATRAETTVVIDKLVKLLEQQNVQVSITPEANAKSDSIKMKITIKNESKKDVVINHSSGQKFDFDLLDANKNIIYCWSADKSFITALTTTTIEAGKTLEFSDTLSGDAYKDIKDKVVYFKAYITGKADAFVINPEGYEVKIRNGNN
ncbi:MAG: putative S-layer protein [Eubacterium sp.]|nr:putative S-layer protein [Eubacterium sp.]